jgi:hypothetical protein
MLHSHTQTHTKGKIKNVTVNNQINFGLLQSGSILTKFSDNPITFYAWHTTFTNKPGSLDATNSADVTTNTTKLSLTGSKFQLCPQSKSKVWSMSALADIIVTIGNCTIN